MKNLLVMRITCHAREELHAHKNLKRQNPSLNLTILLLQNLCRSRRSLLLLANFLPQRMTMSKKVAMSSSSAKSVESSFHQDGLSVAMHHVCILERARLTGAKFNAGRRGSLKESYCSWQSKSIKRFMVLMPLLTE